MRYRAWVNRFGEARHALRTAWVPAVYVVAIGVLMAPLARGGIVDGADIALAFFQFRDLLWSSLREAQLPLWNPYIFSGTPFFPSGSVFYVVTWAFAWLPTHVGVHSELFVHLLVAALGAHWLARRLGANLAGAFACGLAYGLCSLSIVQIHSGHLPRLDTRAWFPVTLAAYVAYRDERRARWLVVGAAAVGLQILASHLQMAFYQLASLGILALCSGPTAQLRQRVVAVVELGALGVALSLVHLLPNALWSQDSARATSFEFATELSLPFQSLLALFVPYPWGDLVTSPYQGPGYVWSVNAYFGALMVVLAIVALSSARAKADTPPAPGMRHLAVFAGLVVLSLLLALGANTPVYRLLYVVVPMFSWFREPSRALVIAELGFAVLAGAAVHRLAAGDRRARSNGLFAMGALALVSLVGCVALRSGWVPDAALARLHQRGGTPPAAVLLESAAQLGSRMGWLGVLALAMVAAFAASARPRAERGAVIAICALLWLEPLLFSGRFVVTGPLANFRWEPPIPALLAQHAQQRFRVIDSRHPRHFNLGMSYRVGTPNGYDGSIGARYNRFVNAILQAPPGEYAPVVGIDRDSRLLDLLNVRYVFLPQAQIMTRPNALGGAWLVAQARHEPDDEKALQALRTGSVDPRTTVLLHDPDARALGPSSGPVVGSVRFVAEEPNRLVLEARGDRPAYLVLSEMHRDGWSATVDGAPAPVVRANYLLRAVALPAGAHRVELAYWPPGLSEGFAGSLLAGFICVALLIRGRKLESR